MHSSTITWSGLDLEREYFREEVDIAIRHVLDANEYIRGPKVADFEKRLSHYLDTKHVIGCGNGTDALQIALMALELQLGDEVLIPAFGHGAAPEVVAHLGLTIKWVDVHEDTFLLNTNLIEEVLTNRSRVIIPIHLFGQVCDMGRLNELASDHNIRVVEDTAQAIGALWKGQKAGAIGDVGTTSFFPTKNLGCYGDGGAVITSDDQLNTAMRSIANHGQQEKYRHERIGLNSRLDSIQAAILSPKLKALDELNIRRQHIANQYRQELSHVKQLRLPKVNPGSTHVYHQYTVKVTPDDRSGLRSWLQAQGVPSMIYYPIPSHRQLAFGSGEQCCPIADLLCKEVMSLPIHPFLSEDEVGYICLQIKRYFSS